MVHVYFYSKIGLDSELSEFRDVQRIGFTIM